MSIETDGAGNWKHSKKKSIEWIDGIVALIMALHGATTNPPEPPNFCEENDVEFG